ncbi:hypothetical protein FRC20_009993 [Serendipita sp. 405]|nr:hypothetical protein FRC20_009993 [Serendipita sp. 405]
MAVTIPASVLQELIRAKSNLRTSAYTCAAGMMIMLYDWILTFPDEVRYIWSGKQKMSKAKAMFFWYEFADPSLWFIANQMDFPISTALITRFFLQLRGAIDTEDETVILRTSATASHSRRPGPFELSKATGTGSVIRPTALPIPISIPTPGPGLAPLSQQQQQQQQGLHDPEFHIQWQSNTQKTVVDSQDEEEPVPLKELRRLKSGRITPSYSYGR